MKISSTSRHGLPWAVRSKTPSQEHQIPPTPARDGQHCEGSKACTRCQSPLHGPCLAHSEPSADSTWQNKVKHELSVQERASGATAMMLRACHPSRSLCCPSNLSKSASCSCSLAGSPSTVSSPQNLGKGSAAGKFFVGYLTQYIDG